MLPVTDRVGLLIEYHGKMQHTFGITARQVHWVDNLQEAARAAQALTPPGSTLPVTPMSRGRRRGPQPQPYQAAAEGPRRHVPWATMYEVRHTLHLGVAGVVREPPLTFGVSMVCGAL